MPEIKAFRGWRYNAALIKNLTKVYAPPYDVISKKEQEALYKKNPYNVVRLELGQSTPYDHPKNNIYTRAADFLKRWISLRVLTQDEIPAIYVYRQDYEREVRVGFLAAMKLDDRWVMKHENTLVAPKKDRLELIKNVRTNLSPIFGLFEDKKGSVQRFLKSAMEFPPAVDVTMDRIRHRLYLEQRPDQIAAICRAIKNLPMLIADGHHRFEVACQYRQWMQNGAGAQAPWNYAMVYFSDYAHNPFTIWPTHRLVNIGKRNVAQILKTRGVLRKVSNLKSVLSALKKSYSFGVYTKKDGFFIFTLDKKFYSQIKKNPVDILDVAVLHSLLLKPCFGIEKIEKSKQIDFTRSAEEAVARVKKGEFQAAFFLKATSLDEMVRASKAGLKMPQKSTYFYPKLLSGLVFHKH